MHNLELSARDKQLLQEKLSTFSREQKKIIPDIIIPTKEQGTTTPVYTDNTLWNTFTSRSIFPSHVATSRAFEVQLTTTAPFKLQTPGDSLVGRIVYNLTDNVLLHAEMECLKKGDAFIYLFILFIYLFYLLFSFFIILNIY